MVTPLTAGKDAVAWPAAKNFAHILMLEQPSMIKRPVLERGWTLLVGFSEERYSAIR